MSTPGYVIKQAHVQEAIRKASAGRQPDLEQILELVTELDALERTLAERVQEARAAAGVADPAGGKAPKELMSVSQGAAREVDRLLTRKCNRAHTAVAVVREILAIAKLEMKEANVLDNLIADDDPTKPIYTQRYRRMRALVERLRAFNATHEQGN